MSSVYHSLAGGPLNQNWSNTAQITTNDIWSAVPSIMGFRGDNITGATGTDPQTLLAADDPGVVNVLANQVNPSISNGGLAEFEIADPVVALQGSGTADAPYLQFYLDATGRQDIRLRFNARDIDGSADNSIQQLAVHYRVGDAGAWINLPAAYIADASTGPSLATQVTAVDVTLPGTVKDVPKLQIRVMTSNAAGNDEWIGIDDIQITSAVLQGPPPTPTVSLAVSASSGTEAGQTVITVTANASAPVSGAQTVNLGVTGTGIDGSDYTLSSNVITILDGATSGSVTFTVQNDVVDEVDETAVLTISNPSSGLVLGSPVSQNILIVDNDDPPPAGPLYHVLANGSLSQDWSNTGLIVTSDVWANVPSIMGFRGDGLTGATGTDPQTLLAADDPGIVDVNANQTNPGTFSTGGATEFEIANPTVALAGSTTASAPYLQFYVDATGRQDVRLRFNARDIDGSTDNSVQQIAVHYRVGESGTWTNLPAAYIADASSGPSLATLITAVDVTLPAAVNNAAKLQLRVMTTNAAGNDEWIGIDDIIVSSNPLQGPPTPSVSLSVSAASGTEAGQTVITVTATASAAVTGAQTVNLGVTGAGVDGNDYTLSSGVITIPDGATSGSVTFTIKNDAAIEGDETAVLTISNPSAGLVLGAPATRNVLIIDDDIPAAIRIHDIQGASHRSPLNGQAVQNVPGIVTAVDTNGFYLQDPNPDADPATSEAIFVFTNTAPTVVVGQAVTVSGTVTEFRPNGNNADNLSTTEIINAVIQVVSSNNPLPAATVVGSGGRTIPSAVIATPPNTGNVETGGTFDPTTDGIDFWESLEGMLVRVNNPATSSPSEGDGALWVLADDGANATSRTERGGALITASDFNPERIQLYAGLPASGALPEADVGARLSDVTGVISYVGNNFELHPTSAVTVAQASTLQKEVTTLLGTADKLTVATFNAENLDPGDGATKFNALAAAIVGNLKSPDILNLEEIQDNNGAGGGGGTAANVTLQTLINAIAAAGGPLYQYRQIDPIDGTNGGEPGGNIRVAFLFNPARVDFVDRPMPQGANPATYSTTIVNSGGTPQLSASPGLVDPLNSAFGGSRKPLAGEFLFNGQTVFVIGNHFNSKGGDDPLYGPTQPPVLNSEAARMQQANIVKNFVDAIEAVSASAKIVVAGDLNDFEFSNPLTALESAGLTSLVETLPANARYSYNWEGNGQTLDHLMSSAALTPLLDGYDIVHINSEFASQVSDHDPALARFTIAQPIVNGTAGRDTLVGGAGHSNDILSGLQGRDVLVGGAGADKFMFANLIDFFDVVIDFELGVDKLNVAALKQAFPQGTFSALNVNAPGYFGQSLLTVISFDPDGAGPEEARPMVQLIGVNGSDLGVVLEGA